MMEKDKTIIDLINRVKLIVNFTLLEIVDYWEADLCAIGIRKGNKLVYISTYNFVDEKTKKYDYDLELIDDVKEDKIRVVKEGRGVSEDELIAKLKEFFEI